MEQSAIYGNRCLPETPAAGYLSGEGIIVHSIDEVNQALKRCEYLWVDIARDGIALYELPKRELATPMPASPQDAYEMASGFFSAQLAATDRWPKLADVSLAEQKADAEWAKAAAFNLHQAAETACACFLLVRTLYFPRSHNIKFLRSLAEDGEPRLIKAWPRATKLDRRRFGMVKRAYVEARYSANDEIGRDDLEALSDCVRRLRDLVEEVSCARLEGLWNAADPGAVLPERSWHVWKRQRKRRRPAFLGHLDRCGGLQQSVVRRRSRAARPPASDAHDLRDRDSLLSRGSRPAFRAPDRGRLLYRQRLP
ncbi:HEPN domain-containing protein [Allosphingosinicella deserti]|uniref:HEPN domain-containing protein n=1 Tax=Allosphingosinicella deserti TaxID=2116704 RepID=A0A2P7QE77_9SPHN|nr:HEPN domain-containing protein [Sphingomonas deserti]PSJ36278.1 hypothetical protein C7I55_26655 [Sphingomonas deserti]